MGELPYDVLREITYAAAQQHLTGVVRAMAATCKQMRKYVAENKKELARVSVVHCMYMRSGQTTALFTRLPCGMAHGISLRAGVDTEGGAPADQCCWPDNAAYSLDKYKYGRLSWRGSVHYFGPWADGSSPEYAYHVRIVRNAIEYQFAGNTDRVPGPHELCGVAHVLHAHPLSMRALLQSCGSMRAIYRAGESQMCVDYTVERGQVIVRPVMSGLASRGTWPADCMGPVLLDAVKFSATNIEAISCRS